MALYLSFASNNMPYILKTELFSVQLLNLSRPHIIYQFTVIGNAISLLTYICLIYFIHILFYFNLCINLLLCHLLKKWIGRGGPVFWPAKSPDLNTLDFFI